jgi:hypothetical protein
MAVWSSHDRALTDTRTAGGPALVLAGFALGAAAIPRS